MDLAIITLHHPERDFVHRSLASLGAAGGPFERVHLFVGDPDSTHVDYLAAYPRFAIHRLDAATWREIEGRPLHQRWAYNYSRALDRAVDRGEGLVLAEDDVLYDPGFGAKFAMLVAEAEARGPDYVLSLYSPWDYGVDHAHRQCGRTLSVAVRDSFYGTQAMYYPPQSLAEIAELIRERGLLGSTPGDVLISEWSRSRENLLISTVSLVQHIGRRSTGLGGWHDSPSFGRPWPAPVDPGHRGPAFACG